MKNNPTDPLWYIAGIGAMGGLFAGYFYHNGLAVNLILKEHQLAAYQNTGLGLNTEQTQFTCRPDALDIDHLSHEPIRFLICCVKAYDITPLLMRLKSQLTAQSIIILIHNGLGVLDEIKLQLPHLRIICGISTLGAYLEQPFSIRVFLKGKLYLGRAIGEFTPEEINTLTDAFQTAKLPYEWDEQIHIRMWEKFAINCSINLLTALLACKNGDLRQHDTTLTELIHEIAQVLSAYGIPMTGTDLYAKVTQVIHVTANNYSSMYKDIQHHKPTELHYLNEKLVRLAQQKQIETPITNALLTQLSLRKMV